EEENPVRKKTSRRRCFTSLAGLLAVLLVTGYLFADSADSVQVTVTPGSPSANPGRISETMTVVFTATSTVPPNNDPYGLPIQGPLWTWQIVNIEYSSGAGVWSAPPAGSPASLILMPMGSGSASLSGIFPLGGEWRVTVKAAATFDDSAGGISTGEGTAAIVLRIA